MLLHPGKIGETTLLALLSRSYREGVCHNWEPRERNTNEAPTVLETRRKFLRVSNAVGARSASRAKKHSAQLPEGAPCHSADAELPEPSVLAQAARMMHSPAGARPATRAGRFGGFPETRTLGNPLQGVSVSFREMRSQEREGYRIRLENTAIHYQCVLGFSPPEM